MFGNNICSKQQKNLAKCNKSGKFVKIAVAQTLLNEYLSKQTLTYMIINTLTVLAVFKFIVRTRKFVCDLKYKIKFIDILLLVLSSIDLILYCLWIA